MRGFAVVATLTAVATLLCLPSSAGATSLEGQLETSGTLALDGDIEASIDRGLANLFSPSREGEATLEAEQLVLELRYEEGHRTQGPDGRSIVRVTGERTVTNETFTGASVDISPETRSMQVLAIGGLGQNHVQASGNGEQTAFVEANELLAANWRTNPKGTSSMDDDVIEQGPQTGFGYTLEGPWPVIGELDQARVTGNFTTFVNNVTLLIESDDKDPQVTWAGYKEEDPQTLENPTVREYEVHTILLHATNATLTLQAQDEVELYAPHLNAQFTGTAHTHQATGQLTQDTHRYLYQDAPLRLEGQGQLGLTATPPGNRQDDASHLNLELDGTYSVTDTPGLTKEPIQTSSNSFLTALTTGPPLGALATLGLLLLTLTAATTLAPHRTRSWATTHLTKWRARRYQRWVDNANHHETHHEYKQATKWWARVTKHYPERRYPWLRHALAHFEGGEPKRALGTLHDAKEALESLPSDFLELWVAAAWAAGEHDEAKQALITLANHHPDMAKSLLNEDPAYAPLRQDPEVNDALGTDDPQPAYM